MRHSRRHGRDDFQPEGIAVGEGNSFYVGSLRDGDIYRGDLRSGVGALLVDHEAGAGRVAVGMRVDRARDWLVVAGDALYFTDTFAPRIYKVPIGANGAFGVTQPLVVTGPAAATGGFGLNGIDSTHRGWLLVTHTDLGILALIDPTTGVSRQIPLTGPGLVPGTLDGLQLEGRTAWVVQNFANSVARVELSPDLTNGRVVEVITSDLFRVPTTVARHGSTLALVNGRFDLGFPPPFGPGAPPGTDFDVVQIRP